MVPDTDGDGGRRINRRRWLVGAGGFAALGTGCAVKWDRWDLRLERVAIWLPGLPQAFDGFTIAHLTDTHLGRRIPRSFIEKAVQMANDAQPDLVVLTGDYVTALTELMRPCAEALSQLSAPYGRLAVLGNHDYWTDGDEMTRRLQDVAGIRVLKNECEVLQKQGGSLAVVGVDDSVTQHDDMGQALAHVPEGAPVVMLTHVPDMVMEAAERGVDLLLAGHTHGGQIVVPFYGAPVVPSRLPRKFASGLHWWDGTQIYVNRGVGMAIMSVRINCPPEVALITLRCP